MTLPPPIHNNMPAKPDVHEIKKTDVFDKPDISKMISHHNLIKAFTDAIYVQCTLQQLSRTFPKLSGKNPPFFHITSAMQRAERDFIQTFLKISLPCFDDCFKISAHLVCSCNNGYEETKYGIHHSRLELLQIQEST